MQTMARSETKLVIPALADFYTTWRDVGDTLVRVIVGYILFMHGWGKVTGAGVAGISAYMAKHGLEPAAGFAIAAMFLETVGAICVIFGLFTRFFAAALAIEMGIAFLVIHMPHGFAASKGGFEYVLLLGVVMLAIALRGGGPYSVDRWLGREL